MMLRKIVGGFLVLLFAFFVFAAMVSRVHATPYTWMESCIIVSGFWIVIGAALGALYGGIYLLFD